MTSITMRMAVWEDRLALVPSEEDVPQFADVLLDVLHDDGRLLFTPVEDGVPLTYGEAECSRGRQMWHAYSFFRLNREDRGLGTLHRFGLHGVELSLDDAGSLMWEVPPIHELPWPAHAKQLSHDRRTELAERELTLRADSARSHGYRVLSEVARNVPDWIRHAVRAERWVQIFKGELGCSAV